MSEAKVTDLSYLHEITMGDDLLVEELIRLFVQNAPLAVQNLKKLFNEQAWSQVAAEAHKFKPNLSYMGLLDTRKMVERVEKNASEKKNPEEMADLIARIEQQCIQACDELARMLD